MKYTCAETRNSSNTPTIVGEFSLSPTDETGAAFATSASDAATWYLKWSQAQMTKYEEQTAGVALLICFDATSAQLLAFGKGWAFWSWKTDLGE